MQIAIPKRVMELEPIINSFEIEGSIETIQKLNKGLINTTYLVSTKGRKYIFQSINTSIFKNIEAMMSNIEMVNEHLKSTDYKYEALAFIKTKSNTNLLFDSTNTSWRCYTYIEHKNYDFSDLNNEIMEEYGKGIGHFHTCLTNFDANKITDTIDDFHNTKKYYADFKDAMQNAESKREEKVRKSFVFIQQFEDKFLQIGDLIKTEKIPFRVCHNDTKIDNILFDTHSKKVKSIIDLDTIMCNSIIYDFGDAIRTSCNHASENERDISNVNFNFEFFKAFSKGYLKEAQSFISKEEVNRLSFSPILLTLEQSMRFFTDYLTNDVYYTFNYPKQNLDRGLNQLMLAKKMLLQEKEMENYINSLSTS